MSVVKSVVTEYNTRISSFLLSEGLDHWNIQYELVSPNWEIYISPVIRISIRNYSEYPSLQLFNGKLMFSNENAIKNIDLCMSNIIQVIKDSNTYAVEKLKLQNKPNQEIKPNEEVKSKQMEELENKVKELENKITMLENKTLWTSIRCSEKDKLLKDSEEKNKVLENKIKELSTQCSEKDKLLKDKTSDLLFHKLLSGKLTEEIKRLSSRENEHIMQIIKLSIRIEVMDKVSDK